MKSGCILFLNIMLSIPVLHAVAHYVTDPLWSASLWTLHAEKWILLFKIFPNNPTCHHKAYLWRYYTWLYRAYRKHACCTKGTFPDSNGFISTHSLPPDNENTHTQDPQRKERKKSWSHCLMRYLCLQAVALDGIGLGGKGFLVHGHGWQWAIKQRLVVLQVTRATCDSGALPARLLLPYMLERAQEVWNGLSRTIEQGR